VPAWKTETNARLNVFRFHILLSIVVADFFPKNKPILVLLEMEKKLKLIVKILIDIYQIIPKHLIDCSHRP